MGVRVEFGVGSGNGGCCGGFAMADQCGDLRPWPCCGDIGEIRLSVHKALGTH